MIGLLVKYYWTNIKRNYRKEEENGKHLKTKKEKKSS